MDGFHVPQQSYPHFVTSALKIFCMSNFHRCRPPIKYFNDEIFPIYGNLQFPTELSHMYWYYGIDTLNDSLTIQPFEQSDVCTIHTRIIFGFYIGLSYRYSRRRRVATRGKIASQFTASHDTRSPNTLKLQPPSLLSGQVISHSVHSSSQCFVSCRKNDNTNYGIL